MAQDGPRKAPNGPGWPQDGPRELKIAQDGHKMAQDGTGMAPKRSKMAPNWPQDGPKMASGWHQDRQRWPMIVKGRPEMASDLEFSAKCIKHGVLQCFMAFKVLKNRQDWSQDRPEMAPGWSRVARGRPQMAQNGPQKAPSGPGWPKMAPGSLKIQKC